MGGVVAPDEWQLMPDPDRCCGYDGIRRFISMGIVAWAANDTVDATGNMGEVARSIGGD